LEGESAKLGEEVNFKVELIKPVAMFDPKNKDEKNKKFFSFIIRESGRTVGEGEITKIIE
jgi:translation elongation factor EF-Tu-like GTPase